MFSFFSFCKDTHKHSQIDVKLHCTCIESSEISLNTVLKEATQWLDMRHRSLPLSKEVLNGVMNCLGPWQWPAFGAVVHLFLCL